MHQKYKDFLSEEKEQKKKQVSTIGDKKILFLGLSEKSNKNYFTEIIFLYQTLDLGENGI